MQRNRRGIVVYVVLKASQATMAEQPYASVVDKIHSFLSRQPCRGILVTVPGEWEAWFWLGHRWQPDIPKYFWVLAPMVYTGDWADAIRRGILQEQATVPPFPQRVSYHLDERATDILIALNNKILQRERWTASRGTWMRVVVLRTPNATK